jgi:endonuclease-3
MVLLERVAYLVSDERRAEAFAALKKRVGTSADRILAAPRKVLVEVARLGGMHPERRAEDLREIARIVKDRFGGDLPSALRLPLPDAKRALRLFPGIGEPGAEKILLFSGAYALLPLESNGLRTLLRLGFGVEQKAYAASYRSAQAAVAEGLPRDTAWLVRAHQLLRRHGQTICKASVPLCARCPLRGDCAYFAAPARA